MLTAWRDIDDTFLTLDRMRRQFDRALSGWDDRRPSRPRATHGARASAWPPVQLLETPEAYVVRALVPGLGDGDLSVSVEDGALALRGERRTEVPAGYKVHLREREPVAFARSVALPTRVDADAVSAALHDGVLTVTLPKARETLPRQIPVKST